MMNADQSKQAQRAARVRQMAERLYVAAGPTLFAQCLTDEEAAGFAFEAAEAFERVAEARK
jgi:hypothetical protein